MTTQNNLRKHEVQLGHFLDGGSKTWSAKDDGASGCSKGQKELRKAPCEWGRRWWRNCLFSWTARTKPPLHSHWLDHITSGHTVRNPLYAQVFSSFSVFLKESPTRMGYNCERNYQRKLIYPIVSEGAKLESTARLVSLQKNWWNSSVHYSNISDCSNLKWHDFGKLFRVTHLEEKPV